ncbi:MAG: hypothetical protein ACQES4_11200, partial [Bacillota bacterium]
EFIWYPKLAGEYTINSAFIDENNLFYFGTKNGVLKIDPEQITKDEKEPEVVLTDLKLFNKPVKVGGKPFRIISGYIWS